MTNHYIILETEGAGDLEKKVNLLMEDGWVPLGPPVVVPSQISETEWWYQALVRV